MASDEQFTLEIETLRIVVETIGENASTQDEIDVASVLAGLLQRLQVGRASTQGRLQ